MKSLVKLSKHATAKKLRRKLIHIGNLTLNNVLERRREHDSVEAQARALKSKSAHEQANFLNS